MATFKPMSHDRRNRDVLLALDRLTRALAAFDVKIDNDVRNKATTMAFEHHKDHINELRVTQNSIDPYKIVSWLGYILAEIDEAQRSNIVRATVDALNSMLHDESPKGGLPKTTAKYIVDYTVNEIEKKTEHGIGKNGLFVAFHCSRVMKRSSTKSFTRGWS